MKSKCNKYQIARAVAERLPELATTLPPKRKIWQSEDYRMSIFDAAALGITYFNKRKSKKTPERGELQKEFCAETQMLAITRS